MSALSYDSAFRAAGFVVRGSRSSCPFCDGRSRSTVAIKEGLWHCHRCLRGGHIGKLAREYGIELPAPRVRKANILKAQFREWLEAKMTELANCEHQLARRAALAIVALASFPDMNSAWTALARVLREQAAVRAFLAVCERQDRPLLALPAMETVWPLKTTSIRMIFSSQGRNSRRKAQTAHPKRAAFSVEMLRTPLYSHGCMKATFSGLQIKKSGMHGTDRDSLKRITERSCAARGSLSAICMKKR